MRTLCCAVRDIEEEFFDSWKHKYLDAAAARSDREGKLNQVYNEIETHLKLVGKLKNIHDKLIEIKLYTYMGCDENIIYSSLYRYHRYRR